jgi:hypothetical protein
MAMTAERCDLSQERTDPRPPRQNRVLRGISVGRHAGSALLRGFGAHTFVLADDAVTGSMNELLRKSPRQVD